MNTNMNKFQLIRRDARYYYFNNEEGEVYRSPIHCYDEARISMPEHQRDADGYLCLGQYVYLYIATRNNTTYVYPSHDKYEYLAPKRSEAPFSQIPQSDLVKELKRRIYRNLDTYPPSRLWEIERYMLGGYDNSATSVVQLAQIAGESLLPEESATIEYKCCEEELNKSEVLIAIGAFANHKGGTLTLGVSDNRKVVGCEKLIEKYGSMDRFSNMLRNLIKQSTNTNLYLGVQIEFEQHAAHTLCYIRVPRSSEIVLVKNELYVRSGNTSQLLVGDRMLNFIIQNHK